MLKFWKKFRYVALGGILLQCGGCGWNFGWLGGLWCQLSSCFLCNIAWEFLLDNDGVFDLFAD